MLTNWSIGFAGSAALALRMECVSSVVGVRPLLSGDEPFLASNRVLCQPERSTSKASLVLTLEQRLKLDMFLAPLQTWTVAAIAAGELLLTLFISIPL